MQFPQLKVKSFSQRLGSAAAAVFLLWPHAMPGLAAAGQVAPTPGGNAVPTSAQSGPIPTGNGATLPDPTRPSAQLSNAIKGAQAAGVAPGVPLPPQPVRTIVVKDSTTNLPPYERTLSRLDFGNLTFADAARAISEETGLNIAPTANAASTRVAIFLQELTVRDALETLCNAHNLWFRRDERTGVIRVYTVQEFRQDLASFREEKTEVFTLLYPNAFDIAHSIQDLYGVRVRVSFGDADTETTEDLESRFMRFDLLDMRRETTSILSGVGSGGSGGTSGSGVGGGAASRGGAFGGGFGGNFGGNMSGMGNLGSSRMGMMGGRGRTTAQVQQQTQQRLGAEAQGLTAEQIQALSAGTTSSDLADQDRVTELLERRVSIFVTVLRRQNKLLVRTADEAAMGEIRDLVRKLDVALSLVLLEVRVLGIELGDGFNSAFDYAVADPRWGGSFNLGEIKHPNYEPAFKDPVSGAIIQPDANRNPGGAGYNPEGFVFQYLGDKFRARLNLLESKNKVTTLSTPVILTANGEVSRVFVGEERPLNRGFNGGQTVTSAGGNVTTAGTADIEFRPVGTSLLITPSINSDRTVTLRMVQENSTIDPQAATVLVPQGVGFVQQRLDTVRSRAISGTVVAQDRVPLAVGGLIEENMSDKRIGVPGLSKIPILGAAFRRDDKTRGRREIVLLIRPHIISTPSEAEGISRELLQRISINPRASEMGMDRDMRTYGTNDVLMPTEPGEKKKKKK